MALFQDNWKEPKAPTSSTIFRSDFKPIEGRFDTRKQIGIPTAPRSQGTNYVQGLRDMVVGGLRPVAKGVSRLLPGGDIDVRSMEATQEQFARQQDEILRQINDPKTKPDARRRLKKLLNELEKSTREATTRDFAQLEEDTDMKRFLAGAAELGLLAASGGTSRLAGLTRVAPKATLRTGQLAGRGTIQAGTKLGQMGGAQLARAGGVSAAEGAGFGATGYLSRAEDPNARGLLTSIGAGTLLGGVVPLAGAGLSRGANALKDSGNARLARDIASNKAAVKGDLIDQVIADAAEYESRYNRTPIQRATQGIRELLNNTTSLRKIDEIKAKLQGKRITDLKKDESLENLYDIAAGGYRSGVKNSRLEKQSTGLSLNDVFERHAKDKERFATYLNARADRYSRTKGVPFQRNLSDADLEKIIKQYEAAVPTAKQDFATLNELVNKARKMGKKAGYISDELDARLGGSKEYLPVAAVKTKDVPKANMGGRSTTTGKQTTVREATGADVPLSTNLDAILSYVEGMHKGSARARLSQKLIEAVDDGLVKGGRIISEPGAKAMKKDLRDYSKAVLQEAKKLNTKLKFTKKEARTLAKEINDFNKQGLKSSLKKGGKRPLPEFSVENLGLLKEQKGKTSTSRAFFKDLIEADPADVTRLQKKIANREPKLAAKLQEIIDKQTELSALKSEARGAKQATFEILDESGTDMSTVRGLDEQGMPFTLELPPEMVRLLKGTDEQTQNFFMRSAMNVQKAFQTFWTGIGNPIFNTVLMPIYESATNLNAFITNPKAFGESLTPDAFTAMFKGIRESDPFITALRSKGAAAQGGSMLPQNIAKSVDSIMSQRNFASRTGHLIKNPKEALSVLDQFTGVPANMTRTRIARGFYKDALKKGMSEAEALSEAAFAFNNMAPNFNRTSNFARNANAFIPYVTAGLSGNRAMWQPILANPKRAAAVYGGIAATFIGAAAHNLSSEAGQQFYKEIREDGKGYILENNIIIVLPTASKNDETGEWTGIIKIPIAPEYRKLNGLAYSGTEQFVTGESELDPMFVASSLFNSMTGGLGESAMQGPTAVRTAQILGGAKGRGSLISPDPLVRGDMANLPKEEQVYDWTSNPAKFFSQITGNKISPIQADEIIGQFGAFGQVARGQGLKEQVTGRFGGARTTSAIKKQNEIAFPSSSSLSQKMRDANRGVSGAREIAIEHNNMIDGLIEQVRRSNMSEAAKKEQEEKLKRTKASTEDYALKSRLNQ